MIILYYKYKNHKTGKLEKEIIEMFDKAEEFKSYIKGALINMENDLKADGELENDLLFYPQAIQATSFHRQLKQYLEMTDESVEVI